VVGRNDRRAREAAGEPSCERGLSGAAAPGDRYEPYVTVQAADPLSKFVEQLYGTHLVTLRAHQVWSTG
jgi:hypothetical protein